MPRAPRYPPGKAIPAGFSSGETEPDTEPRPNTLTDPRSLNLGHPSKPVDSESPRRTLFSRATGPGRDSRRTHAPLTPKPRAGQRAQPKE